MTWTQCPSDIFEPGDVGKWAAQASFQVVGLAVKVLGVMTWVPCPELPPKQVTDQCLEEMASDVSDSRNSPSSSCAECETCLIHKTCWNLLTFQNLIQNFRGKTYYGGLHSCMMPYFSVEVYCIAAVLSDIWKKLNISNNYITSNQVFLTFVE